MPNKFIESDKRPGEHDGVRGEEPFDAASELHDALMRAFADEGAGQPKDELQGLGFSVEQSAVFRAWEQFKLDTFESIADDIEAAELRVEAMVSTYDAAESYRKEILREDIEETKARIRKLTLYRGFAFEFQECFENLLELEKGGEEVAQSLASVVDSIRDVFPESLFGANAHRSLLASVESNRDRDVLLFRQRDEIARLNLQLAEVGQRESEESGELEEARAQLRELASQNAAHEASYALTRHLEADENAVKDALRRAKDAETKAADATTRAQRAERSLSNELDMMVQERTAYTELAKRVVSEEARAEALEAELEQVQAERDGLLKVKKQMDHLQSQGGIGRDTSAQVAALQAKVAEMGRVIHEKSSHIEHLTVERDVLAKLPQLIGMDDKLSENNRLLRLIAEKVALPNPFTSSGGTLVQPMKDDEQASADTQEPKQEPKNDDDVYDFFDQAEQSGKVDANELPLPSSGVGSGLHFLTKEDGTHVYPESLKQSVESVFTKADKTAMVELPKGASAPAQQPQEPENKVIHGTHGLLVEHKTTRAGEPDKKAQDASGAAKPFSASWDE